MESAIGHLKISENGITEIANISLGFKSTKSQSTVVNSRNASLDGLPAELKSLILRSAPNILALQTLVRSSPLYHTVYLDERKAILSAVLFHDIGAEVLPDALAVHKASECIGCFDDMDQNLLFLSIFKTWEAEELACVHDYILRRHTEILKESSSELSKLYPNKDFDSDYWQYQNTGYFMTIGLPFLCRLLNASSAVQKASILEGHLFSGYGFLTDALNKDPVDLLYETDMFTAAENGQELLFENDSLVDDPNAAWPWSVDHKVCIMYFQPENEILRRWAYVMWDLDRLRDWRVLDVDPEQVYDPWLIS